MAGSCQRYVDVLCSGSWAFDWGAQFSRIVLPALWFRSTRRRRRAPAGNKAEGVFRKITCDEIQGTILVLTAKGKDSVCRTTDGRWVSSSGG